MYVVRFELDNIEHVSLHSTLAGALTHIKILDEGGAAIAGEDAPALPTDWPTYLAELGERVHIYHVSIDDDKPGEDISWLLRKWPAKQPEL